MMGLCLGGRLSRTVSICCETAYLSWVMLDWLEVKKRAIQRLSEVLWSWMSSWAEGLRLRYVSSSRKMFSWGMVLCDVIF